ncbi:MAG: hypothetical protein GOV00_00425 [Candidatus Altiarchaeota archaeon]|nr:hypothetical protein [Candidatus Altiarchaeota archaeon]
MVKSITKKVRKQIVEIVNETISENRARHLRLFGWMSGWTAGIFFLAFGVISTVHQLGYPILLDGTTLDMVMANLLILSIVLGSCIGGIWHLRHEHERSESK